MQEAHEHARLKGVILKGDIPIGVNRHSCDVWMEPKYFNLNGQAGAPPDDFSANGQNWGFPTYNWHEMLEGWLPVVDPPLPEHVSVSLMLTASTTYSASSVSGRFL